MLMEATAKAPASLSNLGPGFDTLGLALDGPWDIVRANRTEGSEVSISSISGIIKDLPLDPKNNCAGAAALAVLNQSGEHLGVQLELKKGIPLGSGIGGSAASAAAAAFATNHLLENPLSKSQLVEAVLQGEFVASKARHGDNAIPALLGGIISVSSHEADSFSKIHIDSFPSIVLLLPDLQIKTSEARGILPTEVSFRDAIDNASDLARLMSGIVSRDWELVGRMIMTDRLVEPRRARLIPGFDAIRNAALQSGALGCALSGSGPAIFSLTISEQAESVGEAMKAAARENELQSEFLVTKINLEGAQLCDPEI